MKNNTIKIGTRGSALALWQAHHVESLLNHGGHKTEIIIIETKGDKILDRSLSKIGSKGVFTAELEEALHNGGIDIAVHSAKDLPSELPEGLEIIAFTERERVNDVLVSLRPDFSLNDPQPWVIGTSSTRRVAMLRHYHPHLRTVDMRGNLQTRMRKLEAGHCDALLLAYAGMHRMGYDRHIATHLPTEQFTPAAGQGSVAIEVSVSLAAAKRDAVRRLVNHPHTEVCLRAERAFLHRLQGGCSIPSFALAVLDAAAGTVSMRAGLISLDGQRLIDRTATVPVAEATQMGYRVAEEILEAGGAAILRDIRARQA